MTNEEKARELGNDRKRLLMRLKEAKSVLSREIFKAFGKGTFDFQNRRLVGDNGYELQWSLRANPDMPESYDNQQTSVGSVSLYRRIKKG